MTDIVEMLEGYQSMDTFPKNGDRCEIRFEYGTVTKGWFWGREIVGKGYGIRGDQNMLSKWLHPVGWKKQEGPGNTDG